LVALFEYMMIHGLTNPKSSLIFERILIPASSGLTSLKKRKDTTVHWKIKSNMRSDTV